MVVATPIGNLGDISSRAIDVLNRVDVVAAEDTRTALKLFNLLGIEGKKRFISFDQSMEERKTQQIVELIENGRDVALVSEAGCPCISDPGQVLVRKCRERGISVEVVPGPSAPIVALILSGFPSTPFTFLGFLPRKEGEKKKIFSAYASLRTSLVFFERKSRLKGSLRAAFNTLGDREVCIVREMTKLHEETIFSSLSRWDEIGDLKGEITVVIAPGSSPEEKTSVEQLEKLFREEARLGGGIKEIVERIYRRSKGWDKKALYNLCIKLK